VLIPAHVWTPWFSLFGSKSGFNSLEDCFGDLSPHIFALETGLSSDPAMNRRVSALDAYALVSNSDAHSPANLGREANLFAGDPSFGGMFDALRATAARRSQSGASCGFLGTLEFCPEEGKYHLDGHRACGVVLQPQESAALKNICPVCGRPLTIGVLHRVLELADRDAPPDNLPCEPEAKPVIPLVELISEILGAGAQSRKVQERHAQLLRVLGPELHILSLMPEADIRARWDVLGEAVSRMRRGEMIRTGGYDGEYGSARVFAPDELRRIRGGPLLFPPARKQSSRPPDRAQTEKGIRAEMPMRRLFDAPCGQKGHAGGEGVAAPRQNDAALTEEQHAALTAWPAPTLVLAGPGAGKTRILVGRLQWLLERGEDPQRIVAVTFTRRAALEMRERLAATLPDHSALPRCDTLHGLAFNMLRRRNPRISLLSEEEAFALFCEANAPTPRREQRALWETVAIARENGSALPPEAARCAELYKERKAGRPDLLDYQDLLEFLKDRLGKLRRPERPAHVLVDEVQDFSPMQLGLVRDMAPSDGTGLFAIGDPDQAIYGFRGATAHCADALRAFWPGLQTFRLEKSFRAGQEVLALAQTLLGEQGKCGKLTAARTLRCRLDSYTAPDDRAEAAAIAGRIGKLLGATSHTLLDRSAEQLPEEQLSPGSIAVLVRLKAQMPLLRAALEREGIPCIAPALEDDPEPPGEARPGWLREAEQARVKAERVQILTLHAAKGLEFEAVFLPGLEDGIVPLRRAALFGRPADNAEQNGTPTDAPAARQDECDVDEERRLLYVGLTRAARRIFLARAVGRRLYGRLLKLPPSPFLEDIKQLCHEGALVVRRRAAIKTLSLFS
jgi:superfamily I DNA/RNA helicase